MVTLLDLLNASSHIHCSVLAGFEGLNREVKTITSIESPKSVEMLSGDEFVLSSGVLFEGKNIDQLYTFVEQLISQGCVALGIKIRFVQEIPESVIELAGINNFTLLLMPDDCLWSELFSTFYKMTELNNMRIIDTSENNIRVLKHLSNYGAGCIDQKFVDIIRFGAVITDAHFKILAQNNQQGVDRITDYLAEIDNSRHNDRVNAELAGSFRSFIYKDLRITDIVLIRNAHLLLCHTQRSLSLDEIELLQMNYNNLLNANRADEGTNCILDHIVEQVLDGLINSSQVLNLNSLISSPEFRDAKCMIFYYIGEDITSFIEGFSRQLKKHSAFKGVRFFYHSNGARNEYVVLYLRKIIADAAPGNYFFNTLSEMGLQDTKYKVYFGNPVKFVGDILSSYRQAALCRRYGEVIWKSSRILFYRDIECLAFLEDSEISVEEIAELDKSIKSFNAIETLEAVLENKSVKQAAAECFIHENTMRYRISRIKKTLNTDISSSMTAMNLLIKIKLYRLMAIETDF